MSQRRFSGKAAMTLVEILVAMTILIIVSAATMLIFRSISNAWRTGQLRTERYQQARLLIDLFTREVSACTANTRFPLVGTAAGDPKRVKKEGVGDELFFAGTLAGRDRIIERGYWLLSDGALMCHDDPAADGNYATGVAEVCARDVTGLTITYFDGMDWQPRWDARTGQAQAGQWPKAVRFSITIGRKRPETFETMVNVPTS